MGNLRAELIKLLHLPGGWAAFVVGLLVAPVIAFITSTDTLGGIQRGTLPAASAIGDAGFQELAFGVIGAIILGVVAISSEYLAEGEDSGGTRQITTSLTAVPSRALFLISKTFALILTLAVLAVVTSAVTLTVSQAVLGKYAAAVTGDTVLRVAGVVLYWVLTALLAYGIALLTRSGILPLAVLILNTSVVSVTYLLSRAVPAANYLPDMVGTRMFIRNIESSVSIAPATGGLVMALWVVVLLAVAAAVFHRRDA